MDLSNKYMVGSAGSGEIVIMVPPTGFLSREEALVFAAWIVVLAERGEPGFDTIREMVEGC